MDNNKLIIFHNNQAAAITTTDVICSRNNIRIEDLNLKADNVLLKIEHHGLTTLLDFSNAKDYQVIYLNYQLAIMNNTNDLDEPSGYLRSWLHIVGVSFAINNEAGFMLQTQEKFILLIRKEEKNEEYEIIQDLLKNSK